MKNIYQKFKVSADRFKDKNAIVETERAITYRDLHKSVLELVEYFKSISINKGDVVVLICDNCIEYLICYLAACKSEICFIPIDTRLTDEELLRITRIVRPNAIICKEKYKDTAESIMKDTAPNSFVCTEKQVYGNTLKFLYYETKIEKNSEFRDGDFTVLFSSGTTGGAKGVIFSQEVIINQIAIYARYFEMKAEDRVLCPVTLIHSYGIFDHSLSALMIGATLYLPDISMMNPRMLLKLVHKNQITFFGTLPYMYDLMASLNSKTEYDFASVRYMICGGAPLQEETIQKFASKYGRKINQVYGLTEVGYICFNREAEKIDSIGKAFSELTLKVVDEQGGECPANIEGELAVKLDDMVARGYICNEDEQKAMYHDGWFYTKDIVTMDQEGYLNYKGRISDFINVGGNKIYATDIESVINMIPGVKDNAVLGLDNEFGHQEICTVIIPDSFENLEELKMTVHDQCMKNLAPFKRPTQIRFIKEFPKTNLGKISKGSLRRALSEN